MTRVLPSEPISKWKKRTDSTKLFSVLHMHAMAWTCPYTSHAHTVIIKLLPYNSHQEITEITVYQLCIFVIEAIHQKPDSQKLPGLEEHARNTSIPEAKARRFRVPGEHGLHSEFEASPCYIEKACLRRKKAKRK